MDIHIVNGPNLNLLGLRQPEIYGTQDFDSYYLELEKSFPTENFHYFQSNHEGALIDYLQAVGFEENTGIVFNPAAYTHTSIALGDTVAAISAPVIEVHISDLSQREKFRQQSFIRPHVEHQIMGKGLVGYQEAIVLLLEQKN